MDGVGGIEELAELLTLPKQLEGAPDWKSQHKVKKSQTPPRNLRVAVEASLSVEGVTLEALRLRIAAPRFELAFLGWPGVVASEEDLPNAAPLEDPGDFAALLSLAAGELYVENLTDIGEPPWEASLSLP